MQWEERFLFYVCFDGERIERCESQDEALDVCRSLNVLQTGHYVTNA
jgi:hypothetical protein